MFLRSDMPSPPASREASKKQTPSRPEMFYLVAQTGVEPYSFYDVWPRKLEARRPEKAFKS